MNTTTMNEMNTMENVNTTTLKKEEENTMTTLTEERKAELIERLKEVNTDSYYTDDTIEELYEITAGLDLDDLVDDFENIWDAETMLEYIKEMSNDLDDIIYRLNYCSPGAQYYKMNAYGNFEDITDADLKMLVDCIIMSIEQAE